MDINFYRGLITVLSFLIFLGIIIWSILPKNKSSFDQAAQLPLFED